MRHRRSSLLDPLGSRDLWNGSRPDDEFEIPAHGEVWPEGQVLKHKPQTALVRRDQVPFWTGDGPALQPDFAGIRPLQSRNQAQQRRLARPAWTDDHHALSCRNVQRHAGDTGPTVIALRHADQPEKGGRQRPFRVDRTIATTTNGPRMTSD
jgi:hypothetical protein